MITLSVTASVQLRSREQVIERANRRHPRDSMPSHSPTKDRSPNSDRSLSAFAGKADASGSKAMAARTTIFFIDVPPFERDCLS